MSKFEDVLHNIVLGQAPDGFYYNRIFVVSAYNNVTNWLLEHKKTGEPGVYDLFVRNGDYKKALEGLLQKLLDINRDLKVIKLDLQMADAFIRERVDQCRNYLVSLEEVMASGYVNKQNILLAAREILASIGEAHSAFNSVNILKNHGVNATFVDLCGFHDAEYLSIDERIHRAFSDMIQNSKPVGATNFNVADQLADIGMEAIHPKASKPLEVAGINIRIKNTFEPQHPGTLISKDYVGEESRVEIISGSDKVIALEVHDPFMVGQVGYDMNLMKVIQRHHISYILKATNANSITMVVWEKDVTKALETELKGLYHKVTMKKAALICAMGTNITYPGSLAKAATALYEGCVNVEAVSQSLMQVNMQFVINRKDYKNAIIALNQALCVEGWKT